VSTTAPAADLPLQVLRNAVADLERVVVTLGATEGDLDAHRPGGAVQPGLTALDWLTYYGWLSARAVAAHAPSGRSALDVSDDAAMDRPLPVTLESGDVLHVHPKSARALFVLRALDAELQAIGPAVAALLAGEMPAPEATHAAVWGPLLQSRLLQLWVWVATDGIDLPFEETAPDPPIPARYHALRPRDVFRILEAHVQVNQLDLELLVRQFPSTDTGAAPRSVADVLAAVAHEQGIPTATLMCARSLRGLYHQAQAAAVAAHQRVGRRGA